MEEDFDTDGPTLDQRFYDKLAIALAERVKQCDSRVPVVTGRFIVAGEWVFIHVLSRLLRTSAWIITSANRKRLYRPLCRSIGRWSASVRTTNMEGG